MEKCKSCLYDKFPHMNQLIKFVLYATIAEMLPQIIFFYLDTQTDRMMFINSTGG